MRLHLTSAALALTVFTLPALADARATTEQIEKIDAYLTSVQCEVDPANIELEDDGSFDLDDVMCVDGQYDVKLNADFTEASRRKE